ncbi:MAG: patatin-like phospholipase family protein [Anaerolineales bacterium]|nr:MAG: patatin-like phospholipase family protein [Anaerolineales bacterium]
MFRWRKAPRVGLALSGGGARGLAHIGVLKVFEEQGVPIHALAGTSMGGLIAAAYAAGMSASGLEAATLKMTNLRELAGLVDLRPPRRGLLAGERVRKYLSQFVSENLTFDELMLPVAMQAVDLKSGKEYTLREGNVLDAVMATSAFPGVFPPVEIHDCQLVDGGVLNNLPTELPRQLGADVVIAVYVTAAVDADQLDERSDRSFFTRGIAKDIMRVSLIVSRAMTEVKLKEAPPDLLLCPPIPAKVGVFSGFTHAAEIIAAGETCARENLKKVRKIARA